ncbi:hypothetical protein [Paenimyroides aestuarii]|uniref:Uncharacterized protein n=1 Tax=Paenimyroides aestuarii TaxID=2968490 RepID=A0ABY5NNY7_9FLAO|nr:hypothetical protein [Paenimyroides aestuarii]UUV20274.1 hypothetical protein NPX36_07810 [Paenimyroides aestuarii]
MKNTNSLNTAVCTFNRTLKHSMKRKRIGERSDGFDVLASQVNFNRLKMHRN